MRSRYLTVFLFLLNCSMLHAKLEMAYVVEVETVKPVEKFMVERRYIGTIRAENFSLLSPRTAGTVSKIAVVPGQKVKQGQLLVSLKGSVEKREVELLEKNLKSLKDELRRNRELLSSQDVTKSQVEKLEREVIAARSKLEVMENVEIRAPFDGEVGVPRVVLGESVQPSTIIISVMAGPYSVFIDIPASRLSEVKAGQPVTLKFANTVISAVEKSIDPVKRTGFAKAVFKTCENCIIGDSVYANITVHEKPNAILVNRNAIFYTNQKPHVVVVKKDADNKDRADIREITVGEEQSGRLEVTSGLSAGDEIVAANPKRIAKNALLTVLR